MKPSNLLRIVTVAALLLCGMGCSNSGNNGAASAASIVGSWRGQWGPSPERQTQVMVEFRSEGGNLHGTVNPGPNAIEFSKTSFDSSSGEIKMELNGPNSRGEVVHYAIEGKLSGATMSGTFDRAGETGTFRLEKQ